MNGHPFRSLESVDNSAIIREQMLGALAMLKLWEPWRPYIVGGALWSWAAGKPARDIDIFVASTRWSRMFATATCQPKKVDPLSHMQCLGMDHYEVLLKTYGVEVYQTKTPTCPTAVDIIMLVQSSSSKVQSFPIPDYAHCRVAYGLHSYCIEGSAAYVDGNLELLHVSGGRSKETVMGKLQPSLWRNQLAAQAITDTIRQLINLQRVDPPDQVASFTALDLGRCTIQRVQSS